MNNTNQDVEKQIMMLKERSKTLKAEAQRILNPTKELPAAIDQQTGLEDFLSAHFELRRNLVTGNVEFLELDSNQNDFRELDEIYINSIIFRAKRMGLLYKKNDLKNLLYSDFVDDYDPMVLYANGLPTRDDDDPDYIEMLSNTVTVPEEKRVNWLNWLRKWLVAAIACAINPKVINQTVLVLTGAQAVGKTRWFTNLVPEDLSRFYYTGAINPTSKDSIIHTAECFIINLDELGSFVEKRTEDFKELITKDGIRIRKPYSPNIVNLPRRASFVGSTNRFQFLHDKTGSRRILAFEALAIVMPDFNIDLAWAQAYDLYRNGFQYWFDTEEVEAVNRHNTQHILVTVEEEMLRSTFEPCEEYDDGCLSLSTSQVLQFIIAKNKMGSRCNLIRLGRALQGNGFKPRRSNGNQYYNVRLRDNQDYASAIDSNENFPVS